MEDEPEQPVGETGTLPEFPIFHGSHGTTGHLLDRTLLRGAYLAIVKVVAAARAVSSSYSKLSRGSQHWPSTVQSAIALLDLFVLC